MRCRNGETRSAGWSHRKTSDAAARWASATCGVHWAADLASGRSIIFAATGVTDGPLMKGVRFFGDRIRTSSPS